MNFKKMISVLLLFCFSFGAGSLAASVKEQRCGPAAPAAANADGNWGLSFQAEGKPPTANATADELMQYNASYAQMTDEKVLYLTFDAGYENGNTPAILDALKKHQVPAAFFVVGNYLETSPDLVKRMISEGHIVANHTYHHPDMSKIASKEDFQKELTSLEEKFQEITGQAMPKYYRPPQGNTAWKTFRWQRTWATTPSSGAWPTWTGTRIGSLQKKRHLKSSWAVSTQEPLSFSTVPPPPTPPSLTSF